jgi:hypothetical protein
MVLYALNVADVGIRCPGFYAFPSKCMDTDGGAWPVPASNVSGTPMKVGLKVEIHPSSVSSSPIDEPVYVNLPRYARPSDSKANAQNKEISKWEFEAPAPIDDFIIDMGNPSYPQSEHSIATVFEIDSEALEPDIQIGSDTLAQYNPGSAGHPEFCSRPCLYARAGRCSNGESCLFCHLPHTRRAARLDRAHRQQLRNMPFPERMSAVLLVVRDKLIAGGYSPKCLRPFQQALVAQHPHLNELFEQHACVPSHLKRLHGALMSHSVRMLIGIIKRAHWNTSIDEAVKNLAEEMAILGHEP